MPTVDYERLIWENYPSEDTPINAENLNHLEEGVAGLYHDQAAMESEMTKLSNKVGVLVGAPLVATLAVNMIDKSKVYVYTGSETGYTAGNWYYWDGTQWQSGGVYNSVAVNTDKTLTVEDMAADGKATGVKIKEEAKFNLLDLGEKTGNPIVLKDGGEDAPVKDLKVTLEPIQDLHGYDSPWISTEVDKTPYNFRASSDSVVQDLGTHELDTIVGGTVAFNQLVQNGDFSSGTANWSAYSSSYSTISASGNKLTQSIKAVSATQSVFQFGVYQSNVIKDATHKHFFRVMVKPSITTNFKVELGGGNTYYSGEISGNTTSEISCIVIPATYNVSVLIYPNSGVYNVPTTGNETIQYSSVTTIDLTQMLGTTLADYIYTLEQSTAGTGVAWLRKHFPKMFTYHAYDAGSLVSVEGLSAHATTGKNLLPMTVAGIKAANSSRTWSGNVCTINGITFTIHADVNGSVTDITANGTATANATLYLLDNINSNEYPFAGMILSGGVSGSEYVRIELEVSPWTTYASSGTVERTIDPAVSQQGTNKIITFLRVSSGYTSNNSVFKPMIRLASVTDATFAPYTPHTYTLDSTKTLRGIYKLDSSNRLYADGDRYLPSGTVQRRYGVVDLGTLTWNYNSGSNYFYVLGGLGHKPNGICICPKYIYELSFTSDKICRIGNAESIQVRDSAYSDAATFKTAMSGVYLVYELATPTTESAMPYTSAQVIDAEGSEEYVSTSLVPVGHESRYANICPITGYDEVDVFRSGISIWDEEWEVGGISSEDGNNYADTGRIRSKNYCSIIGGKEYYMRCRQVVPNASLMLIYYDANKTIISSLWVADQIVTTPSNAAYFRFQMNLAYGNVYIHDISINYPSTDHDYHPGLAHTYVTDLGRTVYSGVLDVTKGVLTVDRVIMTLGDISQIGTSGSGTGKYVQWSLPATGDSSIKPVSERMPGILFAQRGQAYQCYLHTNNSSLQTFVPSDATVSSVNAALSGSKVLYHLATPLVYHLTPTEVTTLLGHNLISSDGRMELTYRRNRPAFFEREEMYNLLPLGDLTGNPAYCDDGADDVPVKDMSITIEPIQDLHGYDKPWPAGGGKNIALYDRDGGYSIYGIAFRPERDSAGNCVAIKATGTSNGYAMCNGSVFTLKPGTYRFCDFGSAVGGSGSNYSRSVLMYSDNHGAAALAYNSTGETFTITGDISVYVRLDITNGRTVDGTFRPMLCLESQFDSSFAPYSNECPITGYESVDVVRCGGSLIPTGTDTSKGYIATSIIKSDGSVTSNNSFYVSEYFEVSPNQGYIYSIDGSVNAPAICFYDDTKTFIVGYSFTYRTKITVTAPSNAKYARASVSLTVDTKLVEPYTYTIKLPGEAGTVYSGTINPVSGELVVDRAYCKLTASDLWTYTDICITNAFTGGKYADASTQTQKIGVISNAFMTSSWAAKEDHSVFMYYGQARYCLKDTRITSLADWQTYVTNNDVEICYELATPLTYHLDKEEITTLLGSNTFTTNAKTLDLTYRKDLGLYIKKLIETT